ncbi:MAG: SusC/RagA family TonB-linked outer membrane protein, partial [Muribaculaceae bacterium]
MNKANLIAIILSLFCCTVMVAQNVTVRGKVVDNTKQPIIGASVIVKGTSLGQITDIDGKFAIKAAVDDVIKISFIGYDPKEAKVKPGENLTIVLEQANQFLDEVIVVGVSMKKSDLTGAVANVSSEVLTQRPVTTINEALQGRVAGVRITQTAKPGDDPTIRIRGTNTINSGADPIYVVDGTVMTNNLSAFSSINLNDVESVQVLKDASATALYGSRGANGVVLITTKKGKLGEGEVSFDGWFGFTSITDRPKTMDAQQLAAYRTEAFANGYMYNNPTANRKEYIDNVLMKTNIAFSKQEFETMKNGRSYDWLDQVLRTGNSQNYNLSFSKATEKTNFYASLGYSSVKGLVEGTDQNKYFGRLNASTDINKWIKVGATASFTRNEDTLPSDDVYNKSLSANPLLNYTPYKDPLTKYNPENMVIYYRMKSEANNNDYNPFNSMDINRKRDRNYFQSTAYLNINPLEGLNFRSSFALDYATQTWSEYTPSNIQEAIRQSAGDSRAKQEKWSSIDYQWDNTVSYERTFNNLHRIYAMAGTSTVFHSQDYLMAEGERFASDDLLWNNLGGSAALEKRKIGTDIRKSALVSFLARGNYSYDNRYFVTATVRYDGSSRFAKGYKWGVLPSASLGWDITKEHFMEDQNIFDLIKLRAGYGIVGNQDIESYAYQTLYYPNSKDGIPSYASSGLRGTPELTWEKQKQTNIGLDLTFLNQRLKMSIDGFFILNENLLMKHALPSTSGYSETWENIGSVQNNGVEVSIDANIIQTRDWNWNFSASISHDKNSVKELYRGVDKILNGDYRD